MSKTLISANASLWNHNCNKCVVLMWDSTPRCRINVYIICSGKLTELFHHLRNIAECTDVNLDSISQLLDVAS